MNRQQGKPLKRLFSISYDIIDIDGVDNEILSKEILSNKDKRLDSNPLQSRYEDTELLKTKSSEKLMSKIDDVILKIDTHFYNHDIWAHIIEPKQSTMYHDHKTEKDGLSFVYYVTYPKDSGNLIFDFDVLGKRVYKSIEPKVGQLTIWPAGFTHNHRGNPPLEGQITYLTGWFSLVS